MTQKERFIQCAKCQEIDRAPFLFYFGPWGETLQRWQSEGVDNPNAWLEGFGFDNSVIMLSGYVNHLYAPGFVPEILERRGDIIRHRDVLGQIVENVEGKSGIPKIIKSPVENLDDWNRLKKERLNPHAPERFCENWKDVVAHINRQDAPVQLGTYPCGLYGTLRDLMGVEESLVAFYDEPELVRTIMDDLTDFWLELYELICRDVQVDIIHIWEDMSGKQGSLISPNMVREFMIPNYKKLTRFAQEHGISVIQVDTDGDCEELLPIFEEAGINMMMPFEVQAGCDVVALREKYPHMSMMGGINKLEIAKGPAAIDAELARIEPLLRQTGYLPALDHLIPPEISFQDYTYFVNRLRELIFQSVKY